MLLRKLSDPTTKVVAYEEQLWEVPGVMTIGKSRFDFLEGKATLLVTGVLTISPEVTPELIIERIAVVHNKGVIMCTAEQMDAVQERLGIGTGVLQVSTGSGEDDEEESEGRGSGEDGEITGNVGYLVL